jgi:hypothetical protein
MSSVLVLGPSKWTQVRVVPGYSGAISPIELRPALATTRNSIRDASAPCCTWRPPNLTGGGCESRCTYVERERADPEIGPHKYSR